MVSLNKTKKTKPMDEVEKAFKKTAFMELEIETHHYVIYEKPEDYPTEFVVRKWTFDHSSTTPIPNGVVGTALTLELARHFIPRNMFRMSRHPTDPISVVETWI